MKEISKEFIIENMLKSIINMQDNNEDIETICGAKKGFRDLCKVLGIATTFLD